MKPHADKPCAVCRKPLGEARLHIEAHFDDPVNPEGPKRIERFHPACVLTLDALEGMGQVACGRCGRFMPHAALHQLEPPVCAACITRDA